jgi:hypothetical protein
MYAAKPSACAANVGREGDAGLSGCGAGALQGIQKIRMVAFDLGQAQHGLFDSSWGHGGIVALKSAGKNSPTSQQGLRLDKPRPLRSTFQPTESTLLRRSACANR